MKCAFCGVEKDFLPEFGGIGLRVWICPKCEQIITSAVALGIKIKDTRSHYGGTARGLDEYLMRMVNLNIIDAGDVMRREGFE